MPTITNQQRLFQQGHPQSTVQQNVTIGTVVDTNDPQEMGRVRIVCPQWGDTMQMAVEDLPWAIYMAPFGGQSQVAARGPGIQTSEGGIAYGAWWIPKVGAQAVVMCVDGDPMSRIYIGCIFDQFTPHTMPHGRYMYDDHPELQKDGTDAAPYGPYTSMEKFIEPLNTNQKRAFGHKSEPNYEYRTRGADYTASGVSVDSLGKTFSSVQDDQDTVHDGWTSTQGYQTSRSDPNAQTGTTDRNYDSHVYAIVSPGFHAFAMDDRQENNRVRIRTTSGHQIILDDTNERIYIATAQGNNWIEFDQNGTIDMYSANRVNIHSLNDLNLTSDETIRMTAKKGIHLSSDDVVKITAKNDIHVKSSQLIRLTASQSVDIKGGTSVKVTAGTSIDVKGGSNVKITSGATMDLKASGDLNLDSGGIMNALAASSFRSTAGTIHFNSMSAPAAGAATAAEATEATIAYLTSRVPDHEPWARTATASDSTHAPEFQYTDPKVNREERGTTYDRGMYWRR